MRKQIVLMIIFGSLLIGKTNGQFRDLFKGNPKIIHVGVGFEPNYEIADIDFFGDDSPFTISEEIPHIQITSDFLIGEDVGPGKFTAGTFVGFANYTLDSDEDVNFTFLNVGIRGGYALNPILGGLLEPYGGIEVLYNYLFLSDDTGGAFLPLTNDGNVDYSFYAGTRIHFAKKFGLYAEVDPLYTVFKGGLFVGI